MNRHGKLMAYAALLIAAATTAFSDGIMLDGLSPRSIGRGGTNLAFADNGAVLFDNPAGAVNIESERLLDVGVDMMLTDFHYSSPLNAGATDINLVPLPQISLIRRSADGDWAYGIGVFVPAGFSENFSLHSAFPSPVDQQYKSFGVLAKILPGVAYRATDRLSVGATLGLGFSHEELKGPYFLQGPSVFRGTPTLLGVRESGVALVWSAGVQYALTDATVLGATYQSESRFQLSGRTDVTVPLMGHSSYESGMDITWPQTLGLGLKHQLCRHRTVAADVIWTNWSAAFDNFGLRLSEPSNPFFPPIFEQIPLHWNDTVSVRLGYERVFDNGQVVRFGYVHHQNPIPKETLTPYIQGILEHAFSTGYGFMYRKWNVDLAYMFSFSPELEVGTSGLIGGDFDQSVHRAQTHCLAFSLMRQF